MNFGLFSLASTRAMSASAFCISLAKPRAFGGKIDDAFERQRRHFAAHQKLHRSPAAPSRADEISDTRASRLMNSAQRPARACVSVGSAGQHHRDRGGDVHLGAYRADGGDEIDHPADFGFGFVISKTFEFRPIRKR